MALRALVVGDPVQDVADLLARQCERLAAECVAVSTSADVLEAVDRLNPEIVIGSVDLAHPDFKTLAKTLRTKQPRVFFVATYRELSLERMEQLGRLGVDDLLPQPVDATELFRAASGHFNEFFQRHPRHGITRDVVRADGVLIGRTIDLSEGGMQMDAIHPVSVNDSLLIDLVLAEGQTPVRVRCQVLDVLGRAPTKVRARTQFNSLRGVEHQRLATFLTGLDDADSD